MTNLENVRDALEMAINWEYNCPIDISNRAQKALSELEAYMENDGWSDNMDDAPTLQEVDFSMLIDQLDTYIHDCFDNLEVTKGRIWMNGDTLKQIRDTLQKHGKLYAVKGEE